MRNESGFLFAILLAFYCGSAVAGDAGLAEKVAADQYVHVPVTEAYDLIPFAMDVREFDSFVEQARTVLDSDLENGASFLTGGNTVDVLRRAHISPKVLLQSILDTDSSCFYSRLRSEEDAEANRAPETLAESFRADMSAYPEWEIWPWKNSDGSEEERGDLGSIILSAYLSDVILQGKKDNLVLTSGSFQPRHKDETLERSMASVKDKLVASYHLKVGDLGEVGIVRVPVNTGFKREATLVADVLKYFSYKRRGISDPSLETTLRDVRLTIRGRSRFFDIGFAQETGYRWRYLNLVVQR
jgi:hypothetical protein